MKMFAVRLPETLTTAAKIRAAREQITLQHLVEAALAGYLKTPLKTEGRR